MTPNQRKHAKLVKDVAQLEVSYGNGSLFAPSAVSPDKQSDKDRKLVVNALAANIRISEVVLKALGFEEQPNPTVPDSDDDGKAPF